MNLTKLALRLILGRRLPTTEGALGVPGLEAPITIRRDRYGIPHIAARTERDAWFALGFCEGQDRAFQIELLTRLVRGTLAAVVGPDLLPLNRLVRRIGFERAAKKIEPMLDDEERLALGAFADGINAAYEEGLPKKPHEFRLLRIEHTRFGATDSLGIILVQAFGLAANWDAELARLAILRSDGAEALEALDPSYPEWHRVTTPPGERAGQALEGLREDIALFRDTAGVGGGSNNWALSGDRTATGRPMLANDPHLGPLLPPHWYLAHVSAPGWSMAGATFAGTPGFASAHNGHVAWGVTAGLVDNTDLFLEEIGPDGASVRQGDEFVPCEVIEEEIEVKGMEPVMDRVLVTERGPIIGSAFPSVDEAISMSATWLEPERVGNLFDTRLATTVDEFRAALANWHGPSLNVVCADVSGSIAWQMVGQAPVRKQGHGAIPLPGWDVNNGWEGAHVPYTEMPHAVDPEAGYLATANNRPTNNGGPFLGIDWLDGYRLARITELITSRDDWDVASTLQAQLDTKTTLWPEVREQVLAIGERASSVTAHRLLAAWDGDVATDSSAATVFIRFVSEMEHRVVRAKAPQEAEAALGKGFSHAPLAPDNIFAFRRSGHLSRLLQQQPGGWFDDWTEEIAAAMATTEADLRKRFGHDTSAWRWGDVRPLVLMHMMGQRKLLDRVWNIGPIPWSGSLNTVSQSGAPPLDPFVNPSAIASLRMAVDVGDWDRARFSLPGGQSGNPLSPHYADQLQPWRRGQGVPMPWTEEAVAAVTAETLHLLPDGQEG